MLEMIMATLLDIIIRVAADGLVVVVFLLGAWAMLRLGRKVRYQYIARGMVVGLLALLLAKISSLFYQGGDRPFVLLGVDPKAAYLPNPGFPSDHTLLVFTITLVVWASTKNVRLGLWLLGLSSLVAAGRVLALVHAPVDVLGGIACAVVAAFALYGRKLFTRNAPSL